jgi:hypothetical protein
MLFNLGLSLLFFLPIIESFDRMTAFYLLSISAIVMIIPVVFRGKYRLDKFDFIWLSLLVVFSVSTVFSWSLGRSLLDLSRYLSYYLIFVSIRDRSIGSDPIIKMFLVMTILFNSILLSFLSYFYLIPGFNIPSPANIMNCLCMPCLFQFF